MATQPTRHPVNKVVNRPMLFFGVPRWLVAVAGSCAMVVLNVTGSFPAGAAVAALVYGAARVLTKREPHILSIIGAALTLKNRYDPAKHSRFDLKVQS